MLTAGVKHEEARQSGYLDMCIRDYQSKLIKDDGNNATATAGNRRSAKRVTREAMELTRDRDTEHVQEWKRAYFSLRFRYLTRDLNSTIYTSQCNRQTWFPARIHGHLEETRHGLLLITLRTILTSDSCAALHRIELYQVHVLDACHWTPSCIVSGLMMAYQSYR